MVRRRCAQDGHCEFLEEVMLGDIDGIMDYGLCTVLSSCEDGRTLF